MANVSPTTTTINLDQLLRSSRELQPLPASVTRLAAIIALDDWDLGEILDLISFDQALTGRLLRAANSAASASVDRIVTVRDAIMRLGVGTVLLHAMSFRMHETLDAACPELGLKEGDLWRHSVAAALAAEVMVQEGKIALPAESFTAALIHDVGKLVQARFVRPEIQVQLQPVQAEGGLALLEAERAIMGVHHGELGGLIIQRWGLPESIRLAVAHHHEPERVRDRACDAVHAADCLAWLARAGAGLRTAPPALDTGVRKRLRLGDDVVTRLVATLRERLDDVLARYT